MIEIVEDGSALRDPLLVALVRHGDAGDQAGDARRFLAAELAVLEIDVVDDLGDGLQRRIGYAGAGEQDLEAAAVALMGDLAFEHVEAQLPRLRHIALARHEADDGIGIDEATDQPAAGDAVDMHVPARHPDPPLEFGDRIGSL